MRMGKEGVTTMSLDDLVEIRPSYQTKGQMTDDPNGDLNFIQVRDLDHDSRMVMPEGMWKMKAPKDLSNYFVTTEDIIYLFRGSRFGAYKINSTHGNTLPLAHFFLLRSKNSKKLTSDYLWWVLNERKVANQIQSSMKGTMMAFINRSEFQKVQIPVPSLEAQNQITALALLRAKEKELMKKLELAKDKLYERLIDNQLYKN